MARPPEHLRLTSIDPEQLGRACGEALLHYLARYAAPLSPGATLDIDGPHGTLGISLTIADLAAYAVRGAPLDAPVEDYAIDLVPLFSSPLAPTSGDLPPTLHRWFTGDVDTRQLDAASLEDQLGLVITAALGRQRVEQGQSATPHQLAALGSFDPNSVRRLVREGEIKGNAQEVPADEARRWLRARGVAGL